MKFYKSFFITICFSVIFAFTVNAQDKYTPIIKKPIFYGKSKAIRDAKVILPGISSHEFEFEVNPLTDFEYDRSEIEQIKLKPRHVQDFYGSGRSRGPFLNIEGLENVNGGWPADPNGDVGLNHYVQSVNNSTSIWDKSGNLIYGPFHNRSFFDAFPGPWHSLSWSDPVFIYDKMADRWVFTSMSFDLDDASVNYEMLAVSVTSDPLGEYYGYAYQFDEVNDYPKMSVWPNGYYLTYNIFEITAGNWDFLHALVTVVDRDAMLDGEPEATMVQFEIEEPESNMHRRSPLTADFNGSTLPDNPACLVVLPEYIVQGYPWEVNINLYELQPDWLAPENSTFDSIAQINVEDMYPTFWSDGAPQPGNFHDVETVNFYLMYPLNFWNFGEYEAMVGCQTMFDGEQHYIRWYEFRNEGSGWNIYQSGNYMPDDASRYVPSVSMNGVGDIAMVYTKSSLEINPSICLTGRKNGDSLGIMTINELEIYNGLNYVNNYGSSGRNRWGDYASMMVDPVNDSTFWFTSMYPLENTSQGNWSTRIVAMDLTREVDAPFANAGPDTVICGYEPFKTAGNATYFSSILWETTGDGFFINNYHLNATYVRGEIDLENGQVELCLIVTGYEPGVSATDTMTLYLNKLPDVNAGSDDTICAEQSYICQGEVSFTEDYYWTSNGYGSFNDSTLLNAIYTPALNDTALEHVVLTLNAEPLYPCTEGAEDELNLRVETCTNIEQLENDVKLKIYPNPSDGLVTVEFDQLNNQNTAIQVLNSMGQIVFNYTLTNQTGHLKKQFDFELLPVGIYFINVVHKNNLCTVKLIIE